MAGNCTVHSLVNVKARASGITLQMSLNMSAIDVMKLDDDQWERYITSAESHPPTWLLASLAGINRNHPGVDRVLVFPPLKVKSGYEGYWKAGGKGNWVAFINIFLPMMFSTVTADLHRVKVTKLTGNMSTKTFLLELLVDTWSWLFSRLLKRIWKIIYSLLRSWTCNSIPYSRWFPLTPSATHNMYPDYNKSQICPCVAVSGGGGGILENIPFKKVAISLLMNDWKSSRNLINRSSLFSLRAFATIDILHSAPSLLSTLWSEWLWKTKFSLLFSPFMSLSCLHTVKAFCFVSVSQQRERKKKFMKQKLLSPFSQGPQVCVSPWLRL